MHAYLIIGDTIDREKEIQSRLSTLRISPFDIVTIMQSETSVGIKNVREFINALQLTPSQSLMTAGVVPDAGLLTPDAQQAILKTLEEPPIDTVLFLGVSQENILLETIRSRCERVVLKSTPIDVNTFHSITPAFIDELLMASSGHRLTLLAGPCKTKDDARIFLSEAIILLREKLQGHIDNDTMHIHTILTRLTKLYDVNQASMNMQLLIESAFL